MPKFEVTSESTGKKYEVTGDNEAGAIAHVKEMEGQERDTSGYVPIPPQSFDPFGSTAKREREGGLEGATGGYVNPGSSQMLGAMTGAALTAPAAVPSGGLATLAGGGLGAAIGQGIFDAVDDLVRRFKGEQVGGEIMGANQPFMPGDAKRPYDAASAGKNMAGAFIDDVMYGGAGELALRGLSAAGKAGMRNLGGITKESDEIAEMARQAPGGVGPDDRGFIDRALDVITPGEGGLSAFKSRDVRKGVELGTVHASKGQLAKGYSSVVGKFPLTSKPFRNQQKDIIDQLTHYTDDLMEGIGAGGKEMPEVSRALVAAAKGRFGKAAKIEGKLYGRFWDKAEALPERFSQIFDTAPLKDAVDDIMGKGSPGNIPLRYGGDARGFVPDAATQEFLDQIAQFPNRFTPAQARHFEKMLNNARGSGDQFAFRKLAKAFRKSVDDGMANVDSLGEQLRASGIDDADGVLDQLKSVRDSWQRANKFHGWQKDTFENSFVGKRFGRTDKNIFKFDFTRKGTVAEDEAMKAVFREQSPDMIKELKAIVGPKAFKDAVRANIDEAFSGAFKKAGEGTALPDTFSADAFEKALKLDTSAGRESLDEMLRGTMVTSNDFLRFVKVARAAADVRITSPADLVTRQTVLGGGGAIIGGFLLGAGMNLSLLVPAIMTAAARGGSKLLTNPNHLKTLTTAIAPGTADHIRRQALARIVRLTGEE